MNIGILGFAHSHVQAYCARWRDRPELGIVPTAGWDHDAQRLAESVQRHAVDPAPSADALLARADIEAVVIGAETSMHAELVEAAASASKTIILQKPAALTLEQADRIVGAVDRAKAHFTMAWQMRGDPQNLKIKELVAGGVLGRILMVRRRHGLATHTWPDFESSWHVDPALNRDIWADDASHPIDFIYWLLGMPASVTAELSSLVHPKIPNDNGIALFRYPDGTLAEASCSFTCVAGENTTEVIGEKGVVVQNYGDATSANVPRVPEDARGLKWFLRETGQWTTGSAPEVANHGERIAGLAEPLAAFLHGRRPALATAREGRDVLRMVLACYESSDQGRRVSF